MNVTEPSERLKLSFLKSGLSKSIVSNSIGVSKSHLYAWLNSINPKFPDCFQLDRLCRLLDVDCGFIMSGEHENMIVRYLSGQNSDGVASSKRMVAVLARTILGKKGPNPQPHLYEPDLCQDEVLINAQTRLRTEAIRAFGDNPTARVSKVVDQPIRTVKRWLSPNNAKGFPHPVTLMKFCDAVGKNYGDIVRDHPEVQDLDQYLSTLKPKEIQVAKSLAAAMIISVQRL